MSNNSQKRRFRFPTLGAAISIGFTYAYWQFGTWDFLWWPNSDLATILLYPGLWVGHLYFEEIYSSVEQAQVAGIAVMGVCGAFLGWLLPFISERGKRIKYSKDIDLVRIQQYINFHVLIDIDPNDDNSYRCSVKSPLNNSTVAVHTFVRPVTTEDQMTLLREFDPYGYRRRGYPNNQEELRDRAVEFGKKLWETAWGGVIGKEFSACLAAAQNKKMGLRVKLEFASTAISLAELPWEFLYSPQLQSFLSLRASTPIVRYLTCDASIGTLTVPAPIKVLAVIPDPVSEQYKELDTEKEWSRLQEATRKLESAGKIELRRLSYPTLEGLQEALQQDQYHILHFMGHGQFDPDTGIGALVFESRNKRAQLVSAETLSNYLGDHKSLRLVVLNACEAGRTSAHAPFSGVAPRLILNSIPAVVANQFTVSDSVAIELATAFYRALSNRVPVDAALAEARKHVNANCVGVEWATPVLYMRSPDGNLFGDTQMNGTVASQIHRLNSLPHYLVRIVWRLKLWLAATSTIALICGMIFGYVQNPFASQTTIDWKMDVPPAVQVGEHALIILSVTNTGSVTANEVGVRYSIDGLPPGEKRIGILEPNQSITTTFSLEIPEAFGAREKRLTVEFDGNFLKGNLRTSSYLRTVERRLRLSVLPTDTALINKDAKTVMVLSNASSQRISNIRLTNIVPPQVEITGAPGATIRSNIAVWEIGSLDPHLSTTNTLIITSQKIGSWNTLIDAGADQDQHIRTEARTRWDGIAAPLFETVDDPDPLQVGETNFITIKVANQGNADLTDLRVVADFQPEMAPVSATGGAVISGNSVTFPLIPTLGAKRTVTYNITARAVAVGVHYLKVQLSEAHLPRPVFEEEVSRIY